MREAFDYMMNTTHRNDRLYRQCVAMPYLYKSLFFNVLPRLYKAYSIFYVCQTINAIKIKTEKQCNIFLFLERHKNVDMQFMRNS